MNTLLLALPELKTWGMSLAIMAAERKNYSVLTITVLFAILFAASAIFFLVVEGVQEVIFEEVVFLGTEQFCADTGPAERHFDLR